MRLEDYIKNNFKDLFGNPDCPVTVYMEEYDGRRFVSFFLYKTESGKNIFAYNTIYATYEIEQLSDYQKNIDVDEENFIKMKSWDDFYTLIEKEITNRLYYEKISDKKNNYKSICDDIMSGKVTGKITDKRCNRGFIIGASASDEDYYWVIVDEDLNLHAHSCVGLPDFDEEVSEDEAGYILYSINEHKDEILEKIEKIRGDVMFVDIWRGVKELKFEDI